MLNSYNFRVRKYVSTLVSGGAAISRDLQLRSEKIISVIAWPLLYSEREEWQSRYISYASFEALEYSNLFIASHNCINTYNTQCPQTASLDRK